MDAESCRRLFNFQTMRMEVLNFATVMFNPVAQAKFVHTVSAGYVTGFFYFIHQCLLFAARTSY